MTKERFWVSDIPIIMIYDDSVEKSKNKGTILFFHGLTSNKDIQEPDLVEYAKEGFLVIGIDSWGHGERRHPRFDEYFNIGSPNFQENYIYAIQQTANGIPDLLDNLNNLKKINIDKIGLIGISMGAIIGYRVLVIEKRIKAAALYNGSPRWALDYPESPHNHLDKFYPTALLSIVGNNDDIVPPIYAKELHNNLTHFYKNQPQKNHIIEYKESGHFMKKEDWFDSVQKSKKWFHKYL